MYGISLRKCAVQSSTTNHKEGRRGGGRKREGATSLRRRFRSSSGVSMPKAASSSSPISSLPHIRLAFLPVRLRGGVDMSSKDVGTQDGIKGVEGIKKMREGIQKALRG
jgi:hypothetical protein